MIRKASLLKARKEQRVELPLPVKWSLAFLLAARLLAPLAQGSHEAATEQEVALQLVQERCMLCHYLDRPDYKYAPSLQDLFTRPSGLLMNRKPVNEQTVSEWIAEGSANMPAFEHTLSPQEIQLIVTFLKEGRAADIAMIGDSR